MNKWPIAADNSIADIDDTNQPVGSSSSEHDDIQSSEHGSTHPKCSRNAGYPAAEPYASPRAAFGHQSGLEPLPACLSDDGGVTTRRLCAIPSPSGKRKMALPLRQCSSSSEV